MVKGHFVKIRFAVGMALSVMLTSCGSVLYMSPMPSAPLLEEKGDVSGDIKIEIPATLIPPAVEASAAFAMTDHIGFQFQGQLVEKENHYAQVGAGYFTRLSGKQVLETYLTGGMGLQINRPDNPDGTSSLSDKEYTRFSYNQYCIQANYGWKNMTRANIDLGLSVRAGLMNYHMYGTTDGVEKVNIRKNIPLAEPMAFFRIGSKWVKYQMEVSYTSFSNHSKNTDLPRMINSPFNWTMGLNFNF